MKVEIYSDVACPWCYIGKRRFERALAAFHGVLEQVAAQPADGVGTAEACADGRCAW